MSYKIIVNEESPVIFDETFNDIQDALNYLEESAEVGQEYQVVEITKTVKYEMKKVLVPLNEQDTVSIYTASKPTSSMDEESLPFEVDFNNN
tara:strand:+ start:220 stop:495 length:276 start_codon:yes stop_codon:yes gene_type:complete